MKKKFSIKIKKLNKKKEEINIIINSNNGSFIIIIIISTRTSYEHCNNINNKKYVLD